MGEWFALDWWRYAWGPILTAGLVWLASTWKTTSDNRMAGQGRMDTRQEKLFAAQDKTIEDLRKQLEAADKRETHAQAEADHWERTARWWSRRAHTLNHSLLSARMGARHAMMAAGRTVPETWDEPEELPTLENPWAPAKLPAPPAP